MSSNNIKVIINDTSYDPPKLNPHSFEYFVERLKEKIIPTINDNYEHLLSDKESLELMRQFWNEGYDIGHLYGYDEGYGDCYDQ